MAKSASGAPDVRVTVCIAAYNGSAYIGEQIESILAQLGQSDELVVVDDASTDDTVQRVEALADPRIRIIALSANVGHVRAFERSLFEARGEYILLSDQDDVWIEGRLARLIESLDSSLIVASNWRLIGGNPSPWRQFTDEPPSGHFRFGNLVRIFRGQLPYFGCAMGMRRAALPLLLPFPPGTEAHDIWIAITGNVDGRIGHIAASTVERRIHDNNLTPRNRRSLAQIARTRAGMARLTGIALKRGLCRDGAALSLSD